MESETSKLNRWRRMQALHLREQGWKQRDIAIALHVTKGTVSRWFGTVDQGGPAALQSRPRTGRPAKLTPEQTDLIPEFLRHGAEAYGFRGEVWTCDRVAQVIRAEGGVSYSKSQVSRLLPALGWTPQVPAKQARQRDEEAIDRWRDETWPTLRKQARREQKTPVFLDESGFYLLPGVVKTYAPQGATPILREWQSRDHLSVMAGVTPKGKVYSLARQEALSGRETVTFPAHLLRMVGKKLLVIWDGSPIHRSAEVKKFLATPLGASLRVERLPAYAPDLNPVEGMWAQLKNVEMRNLVCRDLEELHLEFHLALGRIRKKPWLIQSFFKGAGLPI